MSDKVYPITDTSVNNGKRILFDVRVKSKGDDLTLNSETTFIGSAIILVNDTDTEVFAKKGVAFTDSGFTGGGVTIKANSIYLATYIGYIHLKNTTSTSWLLAKTEGTANFCNFLLRNSP